MCVGNWSHDVGFKLDKVHSLQTLKLGWFFKFQTLQTAALPLEFAVGAFWWTLTTRIGGVMDCTNVLMLHQPQVVDNLLLVAQWRDGCVAMLLILRQKLAMPPAAVRFWDFRFCTTQSDNMADESVSLFQQSMQSWNRAKFIVGQPNATTRTDWKIAKHDAPSNSCQDIKEQQKWQDINTLMCQNTVEFCQKSKACNFGSTETKEWTWCHKPRQHC